MKTWKKIVISIGGTIGILAAIVGVFLFLIFMFSNPIRTVILLSIAIFGALVALAFSIYNDL